MQKLMPLLLVAAVAACNPAPAPSGDAPASGKAPDAAAPAKPFNAVALKSALPEGVKFDFDYNVLADTVVAKNGRERRTVRLEVAADAAAALRDIRLSMKAAGFRPVIAEGGAKTGVTRLENGALRVEFVKSGYTGRVVATTRAIPSGKKAKMPKAASFADLLWLMPKDPAAPAAAPVASTDGE